MTNKLVITYSICGSPSKVRHNAESRLKTTKESINNYNNLIIISSVLCFTLLEGS